MGRNDAAEYGRNEYKWRRRNALKDRDADYQGAGGDDFGIGALIATKAVAT